MDGKARVSQPDGFPLVPCRRASKLRALEPALLGGYMADVFLSYRNLPSRRARVERLAAILEAHGFTVWWDYGLEAGLDYKDQIMAELAIAKVVAPLWCSESIHSEWVLKEARIGKDKLCPARLLPVTLPTEFEHIQAADLIEWAGQSDDDRLHRYVKRLAIQACVQLQTPLSLLSQLRQLPTLAEFAFEEHGNAMAKPRTALPSRDKASVARTFLIKKAQRRETVTTMDLANWLGIPFGDELKGLLNKLALEDQLADLPILTGLVVSKSVRLPLEYYWSFVGLIAGAPDDVKKAKWELELERVFAHWGQVLP